jgi:hypothetical protein
LIISTVWTLEGRDGGASVTRAALDTGSTSRYTNGRGRSARDSDARARCRWRLQDGGDAMIIHGR